MMNLISNEVNFVLKIHKGSLTSYQLEISVTHTHVHARMHAHTPHPHVHFFQPYLHIKQVLYQLSLNVHVKQSVNSKHINCATNWNCRPNHSVTSKQTTWNRTPKFGWPNRCRPIRCRPGTFGLKLVFLRNIPTRRDSCSGIGIGFPRCPWWEPEFGPGPWGLRGLCQGTSLGWGKIKINKRSL